MTSQDLVMTSLIVWTLCGFHVCLSWKPGGDRSPYIVRDYKDHPCRRECDGKPRLCQYFFLAEHYNTMSQQCGDCPHNVTDCYHTGCVPGTGKPTGLLTVNRMMPGPTIDVCQNDTIEVLVYNNMALGEGLSIHWHGIRQLGTPHMDGTNLITQCPIPSWGQMKYRFMATDAGTFYWHSHSSMQRTKGLFGGLTVRSASDPHRDLYDVDSSDHWLYISDVVAKPIMQVFVEDYFDDVRALPSGFLINGMGIEADGREMPKPVFEVEQGKRYRFRVVLNGVLNCPVYISVDNHKLLVIASDGKDIEPIEVDRFMIFSGERWDFVFHANQSEPGNFWMRFKTRGRGMELKLIQAGILRYRGAPKQEPAGTVTYRNTPENGRVLNGMAAPTPQDKKKQTTNIQVMDMKALKPTEDKDLLTAVPDVQYYVSLGTSELIDPRFQQSKDDLRVRPLNPQMSYISSRFPPYPPLTEYNHIPTDMFCNNVTMDVDCSETMCYNCIHTLRYCVGDVVELVMVNYKPGPSHPMHMHGHSYTVVTQQFYGHNLTVKQVREMDAKGQIPRNLSPNAPKKDSLAVRMQSVVIVRFRADNPGFWLFHCHIEFHAEVGMFMLLHEGDLDQMPPTPDGFPRCGKWQKTDQSDLKSDQDMNITSQDYSEITGQGYSDIKGQGYSEIPDQDHTSAAEVKMSNSSTTDASPHHHHHHHDDDDTGGTWDLQLVFLGSLFMVVACTISYIIYKQNRDNRRFREYLNPKNKQLYSSYSTI